jgi:hypothetical protein
MLGAATPDMNPLEVARKLLSPIVRKIYHAAAGLDLKELCQRERV